MGAGTVAATSSRALVAACARLGLDTDALLADAGLRAEDLADADARLPAEAVAALFSAALLRSGADDLALRAALAVPFGAYRVIDFLASSAPSVGEGLRRVARYFPLINSVVELRIHEGDEEIRVELRPRDAGPALPRPYAEFALAVTFLHCRHGHGTDWPLARVRFAFPAPADASTHASVFQCPVEFAAARCELVIAPEVWGRPGASGSSELLRALEAHADAMLSRLRADESPTARVTRLLLEEMRGGEPSLEQVAKRVGMSPRTLQRRLRVDGASFAQLLDGARREIANAYVMEPTLALTEVAYLLGFSEPSAFTRAFQRWYGVSPTRYRHRSARAASHGGG